MTKVCCIEDANVSPKSSSCSMVLRSACSHSHSPSRKSFTVQKQSHSSSSHKRKHASINSHNGCVHLESPSSDQLVVVSLRSKSFENYPLLKEKYYDSFEITENVHQKVVEDSLSYSCAKELYFSETSNLYSPKYSSFKKSGLDYLSSSDCDMNSNGNMSLHSSRHSEAESDITVNRILRTRRTVTDDAKNRQSYSCLYNGSPLLRSDFNSRNNLHSGNSDDNSIPLSAASQMDPEPQRTLFQKLRWCLWRFVYLKIIQFVNFDVWCLTRILHYGKLKAILFMLLFSLISCLVWGSLHHNSFAENTISETLSSVRSSVVSYISPPYSLFDIFSKEKATVDSCCDPSEPGILVTTFYSVLGTLRGLISNLKETIYYVMPDPAETEYSSVETNPIESPSCKPVSEKLEHHLEEKTAFPIDKESLRLLALEVFEDSFDKYFKSHTQASELVKMEKEKIIGNEIRSLHLRVQSLSESMSSVLSDIAEQKGKHKEHDSHLFAELNAIKFKLENLESSFKKNWSQEELAALLETKLLLAFKSVIESDTNPNSKYEFFSAWLNSKCVSYESLMQEINAALRKQASSQPENKMDFDKVMQVVDTTVLKHVDSIKRNLSEAKYSYSSSSQVNFPEDKIKSIVKQSLLLYDADKTGQVDYALESGGGSVISTRCSETYVEKYGKITIFGIPLWTSSNSPRTAIQPDVQPGRCWAFKGSQGYLVLALSATIYPTGFSIEHIPASLSPSGSIDSAPKNFSLWGLNSEKDAKGTLLGEYWYDINGEPLQYFPVQPPSEKAFSYVELQIHSNHGNLEFTCLYRIRVHGQRVK